MREFEIKTDKSGQYRFNLKASNKQVILNMIKKYILFLLLPISLATYSQTTDVVTGIIDPVGIANLENTLFISEEFNFRVVSVDLNDSNPTIEEIITFTNLPDKLALKDSELYMSFDSGSKISKFEIGIDNPTLVDILTDLENPVGLFFDGDELYYTEQTGNKISRININDNPLLPEVIIEGISGPVDILIDGFTMYIAEFATDRVSKLDLQNPTTTLETILEIERPSGLELLGSNLIVSSFGDNEIVYFNVEDSNPTEILLVDQVLGPTDILLIDNVLYTSEYIGNKISKIELDFLSINEFDKVTFKTFPNPTFDDLYIEGIQGYHNFELFSIDGKLVMEGKINNQEKIELSSINKGLYLFTIKDIGFTTKIIKK